MRRAWLRAGIRSRRDEQLNSSVCEGVPTCERVDVLIWRLSHIRRGSALPSRGSALTSGLMRLDKRRVLLDGRDALIGHRDVRSFSCWEAHWLTVPAR